LVEDGFLVKSKAQKYGDYGPITQAGPCRVVKDGKTCKVGSDDLETYGDIFLFKDGAAIWVAWNDRQPCDKTDEYFSQCRIAKWNARTKKFDNVFVDRRNTAKGKRWWNKPECYITSFARYRRQCYGGRRYYEPNWVPTNLRIFWAAPPQEEYGKIAQGKVNEYGGVAVAIALVTGDRTDLFEPGTIIRLGDEFNKPTGKRYYVSEVQTFSRERNGIRSGGSPAVRTSGRSRTPPGRKPGSRKRGAKSTTTPNSGAEKPTRSNTTTIIRACPALR